MLLSEAKQILKKNGYLIESNTQFTLTKFLNDPTIKKLINYTNKFQKAFNADLDDPDDADAYDAFWSELDDDYLEKVEKAVNKFFKRKVINLYSEDYWICASALPDADPDEYYDFYTFTGEWNNTPDNINTGDEIQKPIDFFKTIFYIALEYMNLI